MALAALPGDSCTATCGFGYVPTEGQPPAHEYTCEDSGRWSQSDFKCSAVQCDGSCGVENAMQRHAQFGGKESTCTASCKAKYRYLRFGARLARVAQLTVCGCNRLVGNESDTTFECRPNENGTAGVWRGSNAVAPAPS